MCGLNGVPYHILLLLLAALQTTQSITTGCHAQRQLLCAGDLGLGGHSALALPGQRLIMGHVQLQNRGSRPLPINRAGFKLSGMGGPLDGDLRCPGLNIPAGGSIRVSTAFCTCVAQNLDRQNLSCRPDTPLHPHRSSIPSSHSFPPAHCSAAHSTTTSLYGPDTAPSATSASPLQCGFVCQAPNPLQFTRFQPVLQLQGGSCSPQPLFVQPFFGSALASASANSFASSGTARAFADACAQAFGGE